ncbi:hypothetical protein ACLB2K_023290 [Fragaria x ananassa]
MEDWDEKHTVVFNIPPSIAATPADDSVAMTFSTAMFCCIQEQLVAGPKTPFSVLAMLAHLEAEWIWRIDSDAIFTDTG